MTFKRALVWAGRIAALAALAYLAVAISRQWSTFSTWRLSGTDWAIVAAASVGYGLALFLVAEGWHRLVSASAGLRLERTLTVPSTGVTQIAKYLPGNVLHLVGRHAWLARAGVSHTALARAAAWEAACLAIAAVLASCLMVLAWPPRVSLPVLTAREAAALALAAAALGAAVVEFARRRSDFVRRWVPSLATACKAIAVLMAFFVLQGAIFMTLIAAIGEPSRLEVLPVPVLGWLIGFLTPGAPGGLGTREFVLNMLLTPLLGPSKALLVTALFRLVSTLGDVVCFALSYALSRWAEHRDAGRVAEPRPTALDKAG